MSLIKCPECSKAISSTVDSCPHCGYRLTQMEINQALDDAKINPVSVDDQQPGTVIVRNEVVSDNSEERGTWGGGFFLGLILGLIGLIIGACCEKKTRKGAIAGFLVQFIIGIIIACAIVSGSGNI